MSQSGVRLHDPVRIDRTGVEGRIIAIDRRDEGETDFLALWKATQFRDEETALWSDADLIRRDGDVWILPNVFAGVRS